jgi:hypothetical protein
MTGTRPSLSTQLEGPSSSPSRPRRVRRHAEEALSVPQDASQPHPRVVRPAQEILQSRCREGWRGQEGWG